MAKPLDNATLWKLDRVANVSLAPDASAAACTVTRFSMEENKSSTNVWLLPVTGGAPRQLTRFGDKDGRPSWSPSGDRIAFTSKREMAGGKDEEAQLYVIPLAGGEAERMSDFGPGVEDFKWMPDGRRIVFVSWIWPKLKGSRAQEKAYKAAKERKESAYVTSEALYRHWDRNLPMDRVPRLLMLDLESGAVRDLFEGTDLELPRIEPGASHFDVSPDGRRIVFAHDPQPDKGPVNHLALAELDVRTRRVTRLTTDKAWSYEAPRYSPDGARIACIASHLGRRHTALGQLAIIERGRRIRVTGDDWAVDVEGPLRWSRDGGSLLFAAQEKGRCHLWRYRVGDAKPVKAVQGGWVYGFDVARADDDETLVVAIDSAMHPVQVHAVRGGKPRRLETFNDEKLAGVRFGEVREVWLRGAKGDRVQMFVTFPSRFDEKKKHPVLQVIHGGPYAAAGDTFMYRWNPHLFAAHGYVVAQVNFHGSSGFGFAFRDSIMGRLGELEMRDIEAGTDWLLAKPWADRRRVFASGGSYGGFMVAWMNGHIPKGRYRAYVCHAGVFDRVATFSADSYMHRPKDMGAFFYEDATKVAAQSPVTFAHRMETPTLVIHGANDYRVPDTNGLAYYNTLKARGVDARLVWFPDENHWILKPRNSDLWYREFVAWLKAHDR